MADNQVSLYARDKAVTLYPCDHPSIYDALAPDKRLSVSWVTSEPLTAHRASIAAI